MCTAEDICTGSFWGGAGLAKVVAIPAKVAREQACTALSPPTPPASAWQTAAQIQQASPVQKTAAVASNLQQYRACAGPQSSQAATPISRRKRGQATVQAGSPLHSMMQDQAPLGKSQHADATVHTRPKMPKPVGVNVPSIPAVRKPAQQVRIMSAQNKSLPSSKPAAPPSCEPHLNAAGSKASQPRTIPSVSQPPSKALPRVPQLKKGSRLNTAPSTPKRPKPTTLLKASAQKLTALPYPQAASQQTAKAIGATPMPPVPAVPANSMALAENDKHKPPPRKRAKQSDLDASAVEAKVLEKQAARALNDLNINELKVALKNRKLAVGGKKSDLIERLHAQLAPAA